MPLFTTKEIRANTTIYVWKITEDIDILKDVHLSKNSLDRLKSMKSISHQKGFLSIRHLLKQIHLTDEDLFYSNTGKPLLKNNRHISITHSFDFAAIAVSDVCVGIDIEKNRDKIKIIKHRFTDFKQNNLSNSEFVKQLTYIWAAKESMYKIHSNGGMSFKNDLQVTTRNSLTGTGTITTPELKASCNLYFFQLENYSMAIAIS